MTTISIIGGGASGTLTAVHLLHASRGSDLRVVLHERGPAVARGVAYATTDERHLLNVRSRDMSAFPDDPGHLVEWALATGRPVDPLGFLPRATYAAYLDHLLAGADDGRLTVRTEDVTDVLPAPVGPGYYVRGPRGTTRADGVVLAYGNLSPRALTGTDGPLPEATWHLPSAWDTTALDALADDATVVLVGSGLTAVDAATTLLDGGTRRRVVMLSRNGLLPRAHLPLPCSTSWVTQAPTGPLTADGLAALVTAQVERAHERGVCWRSVVDGLRGTTQRLWLRLDTAERARFVREQARGWEVLRHRMAPEVAARIRAYADQGRLEVVGGGLTAVADLGARARVALPGGRSVDADAVVNCTGPLTDLDATTVPLLAAMRRRRLLARDALGLGVACLPDGTVLDDQGLVVPDLHVVGPPRKGALWETTAVPEIRSQAAELAERLAGRHARQTVPA